MRSVEWSDVSGVDSPGSVPGSPQCQLLSWLDIQQAIAISSEGFSILLFGNFSCYFSIMIPCSKSGWLLVGF